MKMKSLIIRYIIVYLLIAAVLSSLLFAVALIPRESIMNNLEKSIDYLGKRNTDFYYVVRNYECSKIDQYADSVLLNIMYYFDKDHPIESVMWARYYDEEKGTKQENLNAAVKHSREANQVYLRYWHGSIVPVRLFHLFWDIHGIYIFHAVLIAILLLWLLGLLLRRGFRIEAIGAAVSMIAVNLWFVPLCLEYTWMFLVCLISSIITVKLALRQKNLGILFLITGMLAAFLDFLTTETITLVIPLLLALRIAAPQKRWQQAVKSCILWGIGFVGMWTLKWGLAAIFLRINVLPYLENSFEYHLHIAGEMTPLQFACDGIMRNVNNLFPIGYGIVGKAAVLVGLLIVLVLIYRNKIGPKESIDRGAVALYLLLGLIPYVRYVVIRFHAWYHYFFTYRAQAATVMALCFAIAEVVRINRKTTHTEPMPVSAE